MLALFFGLCSGFFGRDYAGVGFGAKFLIGAITAIL